MTGPVRRRPEGDGDGDGAEAAASVEGDTSLSQFSREYSRMFGNAPARDMRMLKRAATV